IANHRYLPEADTLQHLFDTSPVEGPPVRRSVSLLMFPRKHRSGLSPGSGRKPKVTTSVPRQITASIRVVLGFSASVTSEKEPFVWEFLSQRHSKLKRQNGRMRF